jgi:Tfp pilus assembly protein PilV
MKKGTSEKLMFLIASLFLSAPACWAQAVKVEAKVVGKQESTTEFSYVVPGYTYSTYQSNPASTGQGTTETRGAATNVPAQQHTYTVRGAVLSLQLPDGRIAVVNCTSKPDRGGFSRRKRSCRIPVDDATAVEAAFVGTDATVSWKWQEKTLVSLNEVKMVMHKESGTYKLIDVLVPAKAPAPKESP